jgi:hypothetical protein
MWLIRRFERSRYDFEDGKEKRVCVVMMLCCDLYDLMIGQVKGMTMISCNRVLDKTACFLQINHMYVRVDGPS